MKKIEMLEMEEIVKVISEEEFVKCLDIFTNDTCSGCLFDGRVEVEGKLIYLPFKIKEILKEFQEINKKYHVKNRHYQDIELHLWINHKKFLELLENKKLIEEIEDKSDFIDENIEIIDNIFNDLMWHFEKC